ncbi:MAG: hypothetical protein H7A37_05625 [Chlamydiales bacterium]|nr:hypothetical protein [Chlamydiales bacterium]
MCSPAFGARFVRHPSAKPYGYELDQHFLSWENNLSLASLVPFVGSLAGIVKIVMGIAQATIFALNEYLTSKTVKSPIRADKIKNYASSLIKHGLGNIAAGIAETIPCGGLLIAIPRGILASIKVSKGIPFHSAVKFQPYFSMRNYPIKTVCMY